jgi:hypothetical protein
MYRQPAFHLAGGRLYQNCTENPREVKANKRKSASPVVALKAAHRAEIRRKTFSGIELLATGVADFPKQVVEGSNPFARSI